MISPSQDSDLPIQSHDVSTPPPSVFRKHWNKIIEFIALGCIYIIAIAHPLRSAFSAFYSTSETIEQLFGTFNSVYLLAGLALFFAIAKYFNSWSNYGRAILTHLEDSDAQKIYKEIHSFIENRCIDLKVDDSIIPSLTTDVLIQLIIDYKNTQNPEPVAQESDAFETRLLNYLRVTLGSTFRASLSECSSEDKHKILTELINILKAKGPQREWPSIPDKFEYPVALPPVPAAPPGLVVPAATSDSTAVAGPTANSGSATSTPTEANSGSAPTTPAVAVLAASTTIPGSLNATTSDLATSTPTTEANSGSATSTPKAEVASKSAPPTPAAVNGAPSPFTTPNSNVVAVNDSTSFAYRKVYIYIHGVCKKLRDAIKERDKIANALVALKEPASNLSKLRRLINNVLNILKVPNSNLNKLRRLINNAHIILTENQINQYLEKINQLPLEGLDEATKNLRMQSLFTTLEQDIQLNAKNILNHAMEQTSKKIPGLDQKEKKTIDAILNNIHTQLVGVLNHKDLSKDISIDQAEFILLNHTHYLKSNIKELKNSKVLFYFRYFSKILALLPLLCNHFLMGFLGMLSVSKLSMHPLALALAFVAGFYGSCCFTAPNQLKAIQSIGKELDLEAGRGLIHDKALGIVRKILMFLMAVALAVVTNCLGYYSVIHFNNLILNIYALALNQPAPLWFHGFLSYLPWILCIGSAIPFVISIYSNLYQLTKPKSKELSKKSKPGTDKFFLFMLFITLFPECAQTYTGIFKVGFFPVWFIWFSVALTLIFKMITLNNGSKEIVRNAVQNAKEWVLDNVIQPLAHREEAPSDRALDLSMNALENSIITHGSLERSQTQIIQCNLKNFGQLLHQPSTGSSAPMTQAASVLGGR